MLGESVAIILDGGPSTGTTASTIVDCTGAAPRILREGAITAAELTAVLEGLGTALEQDAEPVSDPPPPVEPVETPEGDREVGPDRA
jgi:hypothetical protein